MILPKGIVKNSSMVKVSQVDTEPVDLADIAKFWNGTAETPLPTPSGWN